MAVLAAIFTFAACEPVEQPGESKGKLATPELEETHTDTSITISWKKVSGADSYQINMNGDNYTTDKHEYTFENLNAGTYTIRVIAKGKGYEDSEKAQIKVTISGIQNAKWFTQELIAVTEPSELNDGTVVYPYNALFFTWKGTGIKSIKYGLFESASIEGASAADIKSNLAGFSVDAEDQVVAAINGDGFTSCFSELKGETSYTLFALVTNAEGLEYLAESEPVSTAKAEVSADTQAWLGAYTAQTAQIYDLNSGEITDKVSEFTINVTSIEGTPDEVYVDGLSIIGTDMPAVGQVAGDGEGNILMAIWNYVDMGSIGNGYNLFWYALCATMGDYYFVSGNYPAYILTLAADGAITCEAYAGELSNGEAFEVAAFDVIGVDGSGNFGIPQDQDGNPFSKWKLGAYTNIQKTDAAAAALNAKKATITGVVPFSASVVAAM